MGRENPGSPRVEQGRNAPISSTRPQELNGASALAEAELPIALPERTHRFEQDSEWCVVRIDGEWQEVRFHDYDRIFEIEGLYERIFYDVLRCASPPVVRKALEGQLDGGSIGADDLRVLDLGAGNGIMGEELRDLGADVVVGVDIIPEAAEAADRDRPGTYSDYFVVDMTDLQTDERDRLADHRFNCLTCVAALGFGDIPPKAFSEAFSLVETDGWLAFNIKEEFLNGADSSGFSELIERSIDDGTIDVAYQQSYRHRDATNGDPIRYVAMVARKRREMALSA